MSKIEENIDDFFLVHRWLAARQSIDAICSFLTGTRTPVRAPVAVAPASLEQANPPRRMTRRQAVKAALPIGFVAQEKIQAESDLPPPADGGEAGGQSGQRAALKPDDKPDPAVLQMRM